jgi:hypothetical protein
MKKIITVIFFFYIVIGSNAQVTKPKFSISGTAGVTYDYYGLTVNPKAPPFYSATPALALSTVQLSAHHELR